MALPLPHVKYKLRATIPTSYRGTPAETPANVELLNSKKDLAALLFQHRTAAHLERTNEPRH